jgi:hypothetical protein
MEATFRTVWMVTRVQPMGLHHVHGPSRVSGPHGLSTFPLLNNGESEFNFLLEKLSGSTNNCGETESSFSSLTAFLALQKIQ